MKRFLLFVIAALAFFAATAAAQSQTFSVVYNFGSQLGDPVQQVNSGIISQGRDGNLYSGSSDGGALFNGATYKFTPAGTLTSLYSFTDNGDGADPYGGLTLGTDGNFYGTTYNGGFGTPPFGTVFKMTPSGSLTTLYAFTDGTDGALSTAPPIEGMDGNFYGTTCAGCNGPIATGYGSIYKITPTGTFTVLYNCDITHCYGPQAPLVLGTDGNFYGTSAYGGANGQGEVFKITPKGKLTVLYSFDTTHGEIPIGPVVQGNDGDFYGTTTNGGANGDGVVFRMTPTGKLTVLHNMNQATDGNGTYAGLVQATDGNFYGANASGGALSNGTLFKVTPKGVFSVIYNFDVTTGQLPYSTMVQHTNGLLYGGTQLGGTGDVDIQCSTGVCGVLYSVNIGAAPFVSTLMTSGKVGARIGILGQDFSSSSVVTFGAVAATAVVLSGTTYLTATVPSGATTGPVTVTTTSGTLTSNRIFLVTPQLESFTPSSGAVGTSVTITGVSLTQTSKVTFGGVAATGITVNTDSQLTAVVPTGAKSGKIAITTPGGSAISPGTFTVTR